MIALFEGIKIIFFLLTVLITLLHLKGSDIMTTSQVMYVIGIVLPAYIVFCGILMGYIVAQGIAPTTGPNIALVYRRWFIIGLLLGIGLALVYIRNDAWVLIG